MDGNRDLFWKLLEPEHTRVRAFCRRLAGNREDGDDLCQVALVLAFTHLDSLRDAAGFRPWLYRIVVNQYRNTRRTAFWRRFLPFDSGVEGEAGGPDPADAHGARRLLERAFRSISAEDRALIVLFETEGWTAGELARMTGRSEPATRVRLCRIRANMRTTIARHLARCEKENKVAIGVGEDRLCIVTKPNVD